MNLFFDVTLYFFLFGFCGWVCESIFCSILEKKPVNRGFLNGPICPVYGFGGLIIIYILAPFRGNIILLFLFGMLATTALEYITSWVLEKLFHTEWWNYDDLPCNLNGRVCLRFSLMFGLLSVVAEELLYPPFSALMAWIYAPAKPWLVGALLLLAALDCAGTVTSILRMNGTLAELHKVMAELAQKLESVQEEKLTLSQRIAQYRADRGGLHSSVRQSIENGLAKMEQITSIRAFQYRRLMQAFPHMKSVRYQEQLAKVKEALNQRKNKIKKKIKTS